MLPDMSLILSIVAVLTATVLQDMIPATDLLPVKGYFLTAVAVYYVFEKPKLMSVVIVIWAGILTDVLGGLQGCTLVFLLMAYAFLLLLKRILVKATFFHGAVLMGVLSVLQQLWTHAWVRHSGISLFSLDMLKLAGASAVTGFLSGFSMFLFCTWLERFKGVVDNTSTDVEGINGIL